MLLGLLYRAMLTSCRCDACVSLFGLTGVGGLFTEGAVRVSAARVHVRDVRIGIVSTDGCISYVHVAGNDQTCATVTTLRCPHSCYSHPLMLDVSLM